MFVDFDQAARSLTALGVPPSLLFWTLVGLGLAVGALVAMALRSRSPSFPAPPRSTAIAFYALAATPPALLLGTPWTISPTPRADYWYMIEPFLRTGKVEFVWREIFTRSNEHYVVPAKLLYVANAALTGGDARVLFWAAFAFMSGTVFFLAKAMWIMGGRQPGTWAPLLALCSVFLFSPWAAHNWLWTFSGTVWFSASCFTAMAAWAWARASENGSNAWSALAIVFGAAAAFSYSTGIPVIPAMAFAWALAGRWRRAAWFGVAAAALVAFWLLTCSPRAGESAAIPSLQRIATYTTQWATAPFLPPGIHCVVAGFALIGLFLAGPLFRYPSGKCAVPMLFGAHALMCVALASLARAGQSSPSASRYAVTVALFVAPLCVWALAAGFAPEPRRRFLAPATCTAVAVLAIALYERGDAMWDRIWRRTTYAKAGEMAWVLGVRDDKRFPCVYEWEGADWSPPIFGLRDALRSARHHPFRNIPYEVLLPGNRFDPARFAAGQAFEGRILEAKRIGQSAATIAGSAVWDMGVGRSLDYMVAVAGDGTIAGLGHWDDFFVFEENGVDRCEFVIFIPDVAKVSSLAYYWVDRTLSQARSVRLSGVNASPAKP